MRKCKLIATLLIVGFAMVTASAGVPSLIDVQGRLTDAGGNPVANGSYQIIFRIYSTSSGGNDVWSSGGAVSVTVSDGVFTYLLGSSSSLPDSLVKYDSLWVGITLDAEPEMTPRVPLVSVLYALRAERADTAVYALAGSGTGHWTVAGSVLSTDGFWGLVRGGTGSMLFGDSAHTMVNLGVACTTGTSGLHYGYITVAGGVGNHAATAFSTVAGGGSNTATGTFGAILGGNHNLVHGDYSTIAGGQADTARGKYCGVLSGYSNYAGGEFDSASFVGGGYNNTASDDFAAVLGGVGNTASGMRSVICGGSTNTAAGDHSTVVGGTSNNLTSNGGYSLAFGLNAYINTAYRVVLFDAQTPGRVGINRDDNETGGIAYPIHVGTSTANGNGARLTEGGTWTNGSSRTFKEDFQALDGKLVLERISAMPVEAWRYRNTPERHIGPVAEDFVEAFDVGTVKPDGTRDNQYLSPGDVAGVACWESRS